MKICSILTDRNDMLEIKPIIQILVENFFRFLAALLPSIQKWSYLHCHHMRIGQYIYIHVYIDVVLMMLVMGSQ